MLTKAVRIHGKMDLRLEEIELPEVGDDDVRIKIISDSICMSTYKASVEGADHKRVPNDVAENPTIVGHEFCGIIDAVGKNLSLIHISQSFAAVAEENGEVIGLYILHPNNEGRCGHIANASYAVERGARDRGAGEALVRHCLKTAAALGFRLMQFNAVVKENHRALHLYEKLGFQRIGEVPGGFLMKDGHYADIVLFYYVL